MPEYRKEAVSSPSVFQRLLQAAVRSGPRNDHNGWLSAIVYVLVTTLVATPLSFFVSLQSLVLLYVLSVVITGLRHGTGPALLAACLALSAHNFFFTVPYFGFGFPHQDDVSSLIFLFLIALACGPAASRIRRQFIELRQSNRHLEALRLLGQDLSVAEDGIGVWESVVRELRSALQTDCFVVLKDAKGKMTLFPPLSQLPQAGMDAAVWALDHARPAGRFNTQIPLSPCSAFPVIGDKGAIAAAVICFDPELESLPPADLEMINAMLQQAANTCGRIQLSGDLETARLQTEMEQLRSALLSSVSHDLKSPLSAIMGAAESLSVLNKQLPADDMKELASMILQESHRLDSYIQNLLDMTRLENGTLKLERDWVSVTDLIGSAIGRLKRYFPRVRIDFQAADDLPLLYVNPALLEQALCNILENGIKFSPPGEAIRISVTAPGSTCQIAIEDKGPGIPQHLREAVFDMFYVISEGDHKKPGTGMGLAICRGMIAAHGGRVWAREGSNGKGTCFLVELPVAYPEDASANNGQAREESL